MHEIIYFNIVNELMIDVLDKLQIPVIYINQFIWVLKFADNTFDMIVDQFK